MVQTNMFMPESDWKAPSEYPDLSSAKVISFDTETRDPNLLTHGPGGVRHDGELVGVSIATDTGYTGYFPIAHRGDDNLDRDNTLRWLKDVLGGQQTKVGANLPYDIEWLRATGIQVGGSLRDIQIAEPLLDENKHSYSLDNLAKQYLGERKEETLLKQAASALKLDPKKDLWQIPAKYVGPYAEADAKLPLEIFRIQEGLLKDEGLWDIFDLESRIIRVVLDMRFHGVRVDYDQAERMLDESDKDCNRILGLLEEKANMRVDPWSNKSLSIACHKLKIDIDYTANHNPSFTKDYFARMEQYSPFIKLVSDFRSVHKMKRDFIQGVILDKSFNGRIHANFNQLRDSEGGARTGRFSSSKPNLQQIPKRDPVWGPRLRSMFLPDEGKKWAQLDYSQQEPRVLVHYADLMGFPGAADAVKQYRDNPDTDFHQMVADMAGITRREAKDVNLGMFYGMSVAKLSMNLGLSKEDAQPIFEQYHSRVPFVRKMADECMNRANRRGIIRTLLGRHRHFNLWEKAWGKSHDGPYTREKAEANWPGAKLQRAGSYKALNSLVQGSSADMTKKAMVDLWDQGVFAHITVHDELDFSVENQEEADAYARVMETCVDLRVPLKVDADVGTNWGNCE